MQVVKNGEKIEITYDEVCYDLGFCPAVRFVDITPRGGGYIYGRQARGSPGALSGGKGQRLQTRAKICRFDAAKTNIIAGLTEVST